MKQKMFYFNELIDALCDKCINSDNLSGQIRGIDPVVSWVFLGMWFVFSPVNTQFVGGDDSSCFARCRSVRIISSCNSLCAVSFVALQKALQEIACEHDLAVIVTPISEKNLDCNSKRYEVVFYGYGDDELVKLVKDDEQHA